MLMFRSRVNESTSDDLENVKKDLLSRLQTAVPSQEHVLAHWKDLDEVSRARLATQIDDFDFDLLMTEESRPKSYPNSNDSYQPPPVITLEEQSSSREAFLEGEHCLAQGHFGVMLQTEGVADRTGWHPSDNFHNIPRESQRSIQQLIEQIVALGHQYGVRIPMYLMTSDFTYKATVRFLREHHAFGLAPEDVRVFCQGTLPAICATTRRLLMASPGELARCPDGPGGFLDAARKAGCFEDMARRGIDVLLFGQTGNPFLRVADPAMVGHQVLANADVTTQVVRRTNPTENLGVFASQSSRVWSFEYDELPRQVATTTDDDGAPLFWAGNTGTHLFRLSFLRRVAARPNALPARARRRKVAHFDARGRILQPDKPNAIRFEKSIADLMHHTNRSVLIESEHGATLAPVHTPDAIAIQSVTMTRGAPITWHTDRLWRRTGRHAEPA